MKRKASDLFSRMAEALMSSYTYRLSQLRVHKHSEKGNAFPSTLRRIAARRWPQTSNLKGRRQPRNPVVVLVVAKTAAALAAATIIEVIGVIAADTGTGHLASTETAAGAPSAGDQEQVQALVHVLTPESLMRSTWLSCV